MDGRGILWKRAVERRMKSAQPSGKSKKTAEEKVVEDLAAQLMQKVVGQPAVSDVIIPYVQMFQAGLAP